ncbi:MAG: RHS repeat protein [Williamsia sp.]|nr:RHS repeat protein [Williamsia sp.]
MKVLFYSLFCFLTFQTFGQVQLNPSLTNVVPPSPNSCALNVYGNIPVGPSTGIPQIGVPIYSYTNGSTSTSFDVSLSYHAGGVRVDDMPSNVGLGWVLNAGGAITRTLRGIYDEAPQVGFMNAGALPINEADGNDATKIRNDRPFVRINEGVLDSQNDIFNFNFNGRSGKFVYGKNGAFLMINQQKIKVEMMTSNLDPNSSSPLISKFILTDEMGVKYVFDAVEMTYVPGRPIYNRFPSSWYLSQVISANGKPEVTITYEDEIYQYDFSKSISTVFSFDPNLPSSPTNVSWFNQQIIGKRIKNILFKNGVNVSFTYDNTQRLDLPGAYRLSDINIHDNNNQRGFKLNHDYSTNRLTLTQVVPYGGAQMTGQPPYSFEYIGSLPNRLSSQQDHWGYYNNNLGSEIPHEYIQNPTGAGWVELAGGNRDTDPVRVKTGSLHKMTYPTGGYTIYEMEANQAKASWLDQHFSMITNYYDGEVGIAVSSAATPTSGSFVFDGDPNSNTTFILEILANASYGAGTIYVDIKDASNTIVETRTIPALSNDAAISFNKSNLVSGTYTVQISTAGFTKYNDYIRFKWHEDRTQHPFTNLISHTQQYVGGLRAHQITDFDGISSVAVHSKEYEYTLQDGSTSGSLGIYPIYSDPIFYQSVYLNADEMQDQSPNGGDHEIKNCISRTSTTLFTLTNLNGSPVTYNRVTEKTGYNGDYLGKTIREFYSFDESPALVQVGFPYRPVEITDWIYGLVRREEIRDKNDKVLKQTDYTYKFGLDQYYNNAALKENLRCITIAPVAFVFNGYLVDLNNFWSLNPRGVYFYKNDFFPSGGRADLESEVVTEYGPDGSKIQTSTAYEYDDSYYYQKSVTTINSKKQSIKTSTKHPKEMVDNGLDPSGVYQQMVGKNILNPVVDQIQSINGNNLVETKTEYFTPFTNLYVPQKVSVKIGSNNEDPRLQYHLYDEQHNILIESKDNDVHVSYVWGYNDFFPVAKIVGDDHGNATQNLISSTLQTPTSDLELRKELEKIKQNLPGALVTTYTYSPLNGMTSQTDPSGKTTYYEYDPFGRLDNIRDQDRNVLKRFQYNYASTPEKSAQTSDYLYSLILSGFKQIRSGSLLQRFSYRAQDGNDYYVQDPRDFYRDGVAKLPEHLRTQLPTWYSVMDLRMDNPGWNPLAPRFCFMKQGYSVEYRVKLPPSSSNINQGDQYFYNVSVNSNFAVVLADRYNSGANDGTYLVGYKDPENHVGGVHFSSEGGRNLFDDKKISSDHLFGDFHTVKLQVKDDGYYVYFDDVQIFFQPTGQIVNGQPSTANVIDDHILFSVGLYGNDGQVDFVRVSDKNGTVQYEENFTSGVTPAKVKYPATAICSIQADCKEAFRLYFNAAAGKNYATFEEIAQFYKDLYGELLDVCN